jgi:hypothetical protein
LDASLIEKPSCSYPCRGDLRLICETNIL